MFRVLIPSLCITNPLMLNLSPFFWVIRSFPIPLEIIKHGGDFLFLICIKSSQSNGLVLNISTTTQRNGKRANNPKRGGKIQGKGVAYAKGRY